MLKRLLRVSLSIFAFAAIIFALAIIASIIGERFHPDGTFDIYNLKTTFGLKGWYLVAQTTA